MPAQIHVIYDNECGLCLRSVEWLRRHDKNGILQYTPLQDPEVLLRFNIPYQEAMSEMQAVINGVRYRGAEAVIRVIAHLPGYKWLGICLKSRAIMRTAAFIYTQIAKRRRLWNNH